MKNKQLKNKWAFPLDKHPNICKYAFIISLFILLISKIFLVDNFGDLEILLIPFRMSWIMAAVVGLIASLIHKNTIYSILNGFLVAFYFYMVVFFNIFF